MKKSESPTMSLRRGGWLDHSRRVPLQPASALHLVTRQEMEVLRQALNRGGLPLDFEAKLARLSRDQQLLHRFVEQQSRLFLALLLAAQQGRFHAASAAERERLLRVLAYVRKDDDAIHDDGPGGYQDDQAEVRNAIAELRRLLTEFKWWRLRHEVPRLWLAQPATLS